jgi:(2R)-sulfolactate sulfo-lyase subunit alpha
MPADVSQHIAGEDLKSGDTPIKYGEDIGRMISAAKMGEHVHIHNRSTI